MNQKEFRSALIRKSPGRAGNLSSAWLTPGFPIRQGRLNDVDYRRLQQAIAADTLFVVWSYETPIAFWQPSELAWFVTDQRFSATTTRHKNLVLGCIAHGRRLEELRA